MVRPTREDAYTLLELGEGFPREEYQWFIANFSAKDYEEFKKKYPEGSTERGHVVRLLSFYELAGVLVSHRLLHEDLFFDVSYGLGPTSAKFLPIIEEWQKSVDPALWENAAWLARRYKIWFEKVWKPDLKWKLKAR